MTVQTRLLYKILFILLSVFTLFTLYSVYNLSASRPKIAYVRSLELVYGYNGMKKAHELFKEQTHEWQSNIDTLKIRYQNHVQELEGIPASSGERKLKQQEVERMHKELVNYTTIIQEQAQSKEREQTQAVLNQVNSFVQQYAKDKGYDLILGTDGEGSIIYGKEAYDITDQVLAALNSDYKYIPGKPERISLNK